MSIDWFTVGAQAVNFLVLAWLMRHFLYRPILDAIAARENRTAAELADAAAKKADAQKEQDEFRHKNQEFDQNRGALLQRATDDAKAEGKRLLDQARADADALRAKRQGALRDEQRDLSRDITRWTQKEVFAIARKALADLASASLEESAAGVFVRRLRALSADAKEKLAVPLKAATRPVPVRTAFDLAPAQQASIQKAINETFSADIRIQFETVPDLVGGVELSAGGQKVSWSIAQYLATLEKSAGELLQAADNPDAEPPTPKPQPVTPKSQPELRAGAKPVPAA